MDNPEIGDNQMDEFLDNLLNDEQQKRYLEDRQNDETFSRERELQARINQSLMNRFSFQVDDDFAFVPDDLANETTVSRSLWNRRTLLIGLAASVCGLLLYGLAGLFWDEQSPHFETQSLVKLYNQEISRGFKPYYECRDMVRFAKTFEHRLGVPLTLSEMPANRSMLGISYLGGLSRMTIAMLCEVEGVPVIVFVDLNENQNEQMAIVPQSSDLAVFSKQQNGIVFYELTPHSEPSMMNHFVFPD